MLKHFKVNEFFLFYLFFLLDIFVFVCSVEVESLFSFVLLYGDV